MRKVLAVLGVTVAVAAAGVLTWYSIEWRTGLDAVAPNVTLDDRSVGLMTGQELTALIAERSGEIRRAPLTVDFPGGSVTATAEEIGVVIDERATFEEVMSAGRDRGFVRNLVSWVRGPWVQRTVRTHVAVDVDEVSGHIATWPEVLVSEPVEPRVELGDDGFVAAAGIPGSRIDVAAAARILVAAFRPGEAVSVSVPVIELAPADGDDRAEELAARLDSLTEGGVTVRLLGRVGRLSEETLRQGLDVSGPVSASEVAFDTKALHTALLGLFESVSSPGTDPEFELDGAGVPTVVRPGSTPQGCCGPESGTVLVDALESGAVGIVDIPPADSDDPDVTAWAAGGGVIEVVGEFTTEHACCESRVSNIHRIADLVRGQYLLPGESFSVNRFVGERTVEKGFIPAGVIERGRFTESVGGGISQFATTFFNAAFFAGLELDEYQSHSIYISRYPYGREATLSYPKPDLRITNSTGYPVLIWPTYDDTSITVSIYSTAHIEVEQSGQEESPFGKCTDVETFRRRTYPGGRVVEDSVVARYRPGEGLDCNGNPTPQP